MKTALKTIALAALGVFAVMSIADAQLPQLYTGTKVQDFAVVDDSTGDTTFSITDNADSDTSNIYDSYLWEGLTMECYSDAAHADSAGVNIYVEGSIKGGTFTVLDSVNVTADATPTFGTTDLRAGRYRYIRLRMEGMASTDYEAVSVNVRLFHWGYK